MDKLNISGVASGNDAQPPLPGSNSDALSMVLPSVPPPAIQEHYAAIEYHALKQNAYANWNALYTKQFKTPILTS